MTNTNQSNLWPSDLLERGAAIVVPRTVVEVNGEAATSYLQGQLSQDVENLAIDDSAYSFVLEPQGKVVVWFRITRLDENRFILDTEAEWAETLVGRLERFKLNTPVRFNVLEAQMLALRTTAASSGEVPKVGSKPLLAIPVSEGAYRGWDVLGEGLKLPSSLDALAETVFDALRIESGLPAMGREIDDKAIPAATGMLERSVSFTKGCYTGQELVARMDARGNRAPQQLVGLQFYSSETPEVGDQIFSFNDSNQSMATEEPKPVGYLTSVAEVGSQGFPVALGYVARAFELPAAVAVGTKQRHAQSFTPPFPA